MANIILIDYYMNKIGVFYYLGIYVVIIKLKSPEP